jgi:hypothetical protein
MGSDLFFGSRLDEANQIETPSEIRFYGSTSRGIAGREFQACSFHLAPLICPSGKARVMASSATVVLTPVRAIPSRHRVTSVSLR